MRESLSVSRWERSLGRKFSRENTGIEALLL